MNQKSHTLSSLNDVNSKVTMEYSASDDVDQFWNVAIPTPQIANQETSYFSELAPNSDNTFESQFDSLQVILDDTDKEDEHHMTVLVPTGLADPDWSLVDFSDPQSFEEWGSVEGSNEPNSGSLSVPLPNDSGVIYPPHAYYTDNPPVEPSSIDPVQLFQMFDTTASHPTGAGSGTTDSSRYKSRYWPNLIL